MTNETLNIVLQGIISIVMIATFTVYFFQLRTMRKATRGQNMISVINLLQDSEIRKAREVVIKELKSKNDFNFWNGDQKNAADKVCSSYDTVSILVYQQKVVENDSFLENWGPSIIKCYSILKDYIVNMQKDENSGPLYWNDFKILHEKMLNKQ